ncbi:MAG: BamA/TamA family outer membrane protein, partial [Cyclobacteriaceae bacterium]
IKPKAPYIIDSVYTSIADKKLYTLFHTSTEENPLKNKQFSQELITLERDRIYDLVTSNGYYEFKKQYILFDIDSVNLEPQKLLVRLTITNPANRSTHKVYHYDSLIFNSDGGKKFSKKLKTLTYNGVTYNQSANSYAEKILDRRIFIDKDSLYSRAKTLETQKQLSYLDMFRFVNINYDTTDGNFIANIFTSPLNKFQTSTEIGLSIFEEAQRPGPFFNFNAKNRNLLHKLEIIDLDANIRLQGIPNVNQETTQYTRFQAGAVASLTLPIFYFPLNQGLRNRFGSYNPRTRFSIGINYEDRFSEYERTTFNSSIAYLWQVRQSAQFSVRPIDVSYIESKNSASFSEELQGFEDQGNRSYVSSFRSSFISAASVAYNLRTNNYGLANTNASFLRIFMEYGGIFQTLLGRKPFNESLNLEYYRYFKFNADYRKTIRVKKGSSLAYRINTGLAYVYGESQALPYEKYFFAGGSNSIRAWSPRRLGPGAYAEYNNVENDQIEVDYQREQPGDIILESSLEYRANIVGFFNIAAFIDAGNTWLWRSKTINENNDGDGFDDGIFRIKSFVKEIAVGAGLGLRLDFSFLILRLDGAYKIIDPARPDGDRFVADEITFNNLFDRQLFNLNIGIGYPF